MRTPISTLNLLGKRAQAIVSVLGVAFALLLIFMQLGFRGAVANTATVVYGKLDFDALIRSTEYLHLYETRTIPIATLDLIAGHPDVASVRPFYIALNKWQSPSDGKYRAIAMMGMRLDMPVIQNPEILEQLPKLANSDKLLVDRATRRDYGPKNGKKFGNDDIGVEVELGNRKTTIVGNFLVGTGLATNGQVLLSDIGYGKRSPIDVQKNAGLGLIRLKSGVNPEQFAASMARWLAERDPSSKDLVRILSKRETIAWEHRRWLNETPIGIIFTLGVGLSFIVGSAVVYMVLANDVANRLPEYATLKAMGYTSWFIAGVVLRQAWLLAIFGYLPAALLGWLLYVVTANLAGIPIFMTPQRAIGIAALSLLMCTLSGLLAIRKLWKAEPASLF
jgi:putative ABC transport system permease protein